MDIKKGEIRLIIENIDNWETARVTISSDKEARENIGYFITATEYLMHICASQKSNAGYDKALELLLKGAKTYSDIGEKMHGHS